METVRTQLLSLRQFGCSWSFQRQARTIPIVFAVLSDPIGSRFVARLSRPGGNITGFINIESSLVGKWLDLQREIAPQVSRVAFMINPKTAPYARYDLENSPLGAACPRSIRSAFLSQPGA